MKDEKKKKKLTLAEGEATGHAHRLTDEVEVFEEREDRKVWKNDEETTLTHEEHGPITVPPGKWASGIIREYDYEEEALKNVID